MSRGEIEKGVCWLLKGSKFTRAEVDVEVSSVFFISPEFTAFLKQNQRLLKTEPFSHPIIADLIRSQWFGKGKADIHAYNKMLASQQIEEEIIILVVSAVC